MATEITKIVLHGEDQSGAAFASLKRNIAETGSGITRIQGLLGTLGITASVGGFALLAKSSVQAAIEVQQSGQRLEAVLKATGHSAGIAQSEIQKMAESLSRSTGFNNQAIEAGAAIFLKFGNIQQDVFRQGIKYAADYAAFAGADFTSAAQTIGKALQSPEHGIKALRAEFGQLSPAQELAIKQFTEVNDIAKAQGVILDFLKGKIEGTSEAMHTGLKGALDDIRNSWQALLETTGKSSGGHAFLNAINEFLTDSKNLIALGGDYKRILSQRAANAPDKISPAELENAAWTSRMESQLDFETALGAKNTETVEKLVKQMNEKLAAEKKRLLAEDTQGWVKHAQEVFDTADKENQMLAEISQKHWDEEERLRKQDNAGWVAYAEARIREDEEMNAALAKVAAEANKTNNFARDMGLTFSSAFEDAIVGGLKLSDVLRGLSKDMLRIIARKTVTEPLGNAITGLLSSAMSGFAGSFGSGGSTAPGMSEASIASMFGPKAEGGPVYSGQSYLVGERGPELFMPSSSGNIIPNSGMGVTHLHYSPVYHIDSRTDQAAIIAEVEAGGRRAEARLYDNLRRGGAFAKAVGRA